MPILPSLDQQLRAIREVEGAFAVSHIDTCLGSFLSDHHNRDGELLLGVYVDGETTVATVLDELADEFGRIGWDMGESRKGFDYDKAKQAIADFRQSALESVDPDAVFDSSLDIPNEEHDHEESCQAWFLVHWNLPEFEDGDIVGYNPVTGSLIQWNGDDSERYECETPDEFGLDNIRADEIKRMLADGWEVPPWWTA